MFAAIVHTYSPCMSWHNTAFPDVQPVSARRARTFWAGVGKCVRALSGVGKLSRRTFSLVWQRNPASATSLRINCILCIERHCNSDRCCHTANRPPPPWHRSLLRRDLAIRQPLPRLQSQGWRDAVGRSRKKLASPDPHPTVGRNGHATTVESARCAALASRSSAGTALSKGISVCIPWLDGIASRSSFMSHASRVTC
jgi:hypothetical protein